MIDYSADVGRTFTDYEEDGDIHFIRLNIAEGHHWAGQSLYQIRLPQDLLVAGIIREGKMITPSGNTKLICEDVLVLAARSFDGNNNFTLQEVVVERGQRFHNHKLSEIPQLETNRVILVKRGVDTLIPSGNTVIKAGDILVFAKQEE